MRVLSALALSAALLAGCGAPAPEVSRSYGAAASLSAVSLPATPPRFDDHKPHDWIGRSPWNYSVHGIDVSKWQGDIDWATVRASGVSFAFIKATEGDDHSDEAFARNWRAAAAAGMPRGAYHFYYFCSTPADQAAWFIRNVPRERGALPPVLDVEWNSHSRTCRRFPAPEIVRAEMRAFLNIVERHYGQRPIIYVTPDFYRDNDLAQMNGATFWLRSVAGHPSEVYPGSDWHFWQYTGTGSVPGVAGKTDINAFAGSPAQWRSWVASHTL